MEGPVFSQLRAAGLTLIETKSGAAASYDFTNIPQEFSHLRIVLVSRGDNASLNVGLYARFNNDTAANYDHQIFYNNSTTVAGVAAAAATSAQVGSVPAATSTAGQAAAATLDIPAYSGTTFRKTTISQSGMFRTEGTATTYEAAVFAGNWRSTAAITRITLFPSSGNFAAGSVCSLYGMP